MGKMASPLVGYNNNVRHQGRIFHIQTEDSGIKHPHVITHVFADGGRIIASRRTSYAEHLNAADLPELVKGIMKEQHKAVFLALRSGSFDDSLETSPVREVEPTSANQTPQINRPLSVSIQSKTLNELILSYIADDSFDD